MCRVCVCTCVNVCAHVLTPAHVWYSDDGHRFADEHPPTLCHQPETAMSSSLHPPSLCSLVLLSPRSPHLILSHAPPTPPTPAFFSSSFSISCSPFCSAPVHFLCPPVHQRVTSSSLSFLISIHLLVTTPCQQCSSVMVCLLFPLSVCFFPSL